MDGEIQSRAEVGIQGAAAHLHCLSVKPFGLSTNLCCRSPSTLAALLLIGEGLDSKREIFLCTLPVGLCRLSTCVGALKGKLDPNLAGVQQLLTVQSPLTGVKLLLTVSSGSSSPTMPSAAAFLALCASSSARVGPANDCLGYLLLRLLNSRVTVHGCVSAML